MTGLLSAQVDCHGSVSKAMLQHARAHRLMPTLLLPTVWLKLWGMGPGRQFSDCGVDQACKRTGDAPFRFTVGPQAAASRLGSSSLAPLRAQRGSVRRGTAGCPQADEVAPAAIEVQET